MNANEINVAQRLTELGLKLDERINWNLESIFPKIKGLGSKSNIKAKHKLIRNVEPVLVETLHPGEVVMYVAKGIQAKFWEQYFLGMWAQLINQTVFVLTNVRLLMFNSNTKGKPHHTFWMVYYSEIVKFKTRVPFGGMTMKLKDKSKFVFTGFKGADRKNMPQIFQRINQEYSDLEFAPQVSQSRENLCTVCKQIVPKNVLHCALCGQTYWKPADIAIRSLIFPSWGDWIMGHHLLAAIEVFGYIMIWIIILSVFFTPNGDLVFAIVYSVLVLMIAHVADAVVTLSIAKKGLTPKKPLVENPESVIELV